VVRLDERGEQSASVPIKIMPLNSTTTCEDTASGTICITLYAANPSSTISTAGGFTYGEIVSDIFLFMILVGIMGVWFHLAFWRVKVKN